MTNQAAANNTFYAVIEPGIEERICMSWHEAASEIDEWFDDSDLFSTKVVNTWREAIRSVNVDDYNIDINGLEAYLNAIIGHIGTESCFGGAPNLIVRRAVTFPCGTAILPGDLELASAWLTEANRIQGLPDSGATAELWDDHSMQLKGIGGYWL